VANGRSLYACQLLANAVRKIQRKTTHSPALFIRRVVTAEFVRWRTGVDSKGYNYVDISHRQWPTAFLVHQERWCFFVQPFCYSYVPAAGAVGTVENSTRYRVFQALWGTVGKRSLFFHCFHSAAVSIAHACCYVTWSIGGPSSLVTRSRPASPLLSR
jgi:hypothetical protein